MIKTHSTRRQIENIIVTGIPVLILLLSIFSCTPNLEKKLIGNWKGSDYYYQKTAGPDMVVTVGGGIEQHLSSSLMLNEDRTYRKLVGQYDNGNGTWEVDDKNLVLRDSTGNESVYTLIKITDRELITLHDVSLNTPNGEIQGKVKLSYTR